MKQVTKTILMRAPLSFGLSEDSAQTNYFQKRISLSSRDVQRQALSEFMEMKTTLEEKGVEVLVFSEPQGGPALPDAVFPNNWFTTHQDGTLVIYPLLPECRRLERNVETLKLQMRHQKLRMSKVVDLSSLEERCEFLEGTGSLVLDRQNEIAYAALSPRTTQKALSEFCEKLNYSAVLFHAHDQEKRLVYHTNVVMGLGQDFAVVALEAIASSDERERVLSSLNKTKKECIDISIQQMHAFCGNLLELETKNGKRIIAISQVGYRTLSDQQKNALSRFGELVPIAIPTIEGIGGGSVRCMIAEVFLEPQ